MLPALTSPRKQGEGELRFTHKQRPPFGAACGGAQETGRVSKDARWRRHDKEAGRGRSLTSELA